MKKKPDAGGPAFPIHPDMPSRVGCVNSKSDAGMTLRDYFAAKALASSNWNTWDEHSSDWVESLATFAYRIADAMLEERK